MTGNDMIILITRNLNLKDSHYLKSVTIYYYKMTNENVKQVVSYGFKNKGMKKLIKLLLWEATYLHLLKIPCSY